MSGPFAESATHHGTPEAGNGAKKPHKELLLGGAAAALLVVVMLLRSRSKAAASTATDPNAVTAADGNTLPTAGTGATGGYGNDLSSVDALTGIQASETATQSAINANTSVLNAILGKLNTPTAAPKAGPPAKPVTTVQHRPVTKANPPGVKTGTPAQYVVKPGDNLSAIGAAHGGISWQTLYGLNKTTIGGNPNLIHPGQRLTL